MNSDESSLHILYPSTAGHMEIVGSFLGIDNISGQHVNLLSFLIHIHVIIILA